MLILQDLVFLHAQKHNRKFPVQSRYENGIDDYFVIKNVAIGFALFIALTISIIFSIPDNQRQEGDANSLLPRDFDDESCHKERLQTGIRRVGDDYYLTGFQLCDY